MLGPKSVALTHIGAHSIASSQLEFDSYRREGIGPHKTMWGLPSSRIVHKVIRVYSESSR